MLFRETDAVECRDPEESYKLCAVKYGAAYEILVQIITTAL
jgi:hypothetical protein